MDNQDINCFVGMEHMHNSDGLVEVYAKELFKFQASIGDLVFRFDFCPDCGKRIQWKHIENVLKSVQTESYT